MSRVYQLAPSILSADFNRLGEQIQRVEKAECRWLHIDIMDGMFVPSISFGMPVVKSIRKESSLYFDVHMMVKDPERYVEEFQSCGADMITVHAEACRDLAETVKKIHETGADAGVAVNPDTPLSAVTDVMDQVEMILIMSVYPGFGGQKYIPESTERSRTLRRMLDEKGLEHVHIQVDGGTADLIAVVKLAGGKVTRDIHDHIDLLLMKHLKRLRFSLLARPVHLRTRNAILRQETVRTSRSE